MYQKWVFSENTVNSNVWVAIFFPRNPYTQLSITYRTIHFGITLETKACK